MEQRNGRSSDKTSNDPCVGGFRVPTHSDFRILINNTVQNDVGSFETSAANYGAAKGFRSKKSSRDPT